MKVGTGRPAPQFQSEHALEPTQDDGPTHRVDLAVFPPAGIDSLLFEAMLEEGLERRAPDLFLAIDDPDQPEGQWSRMTFPEQPPAGQAASKLALVVGNTAPEPSTIALAELEGRAVPER